MVRSGVFPSSPLRHHHAFSTCTLHLYHDLFCRCPRLSIQPFIKSLCDIQGFPFKPYLMQQFSSAYDVYVEVKSRTRKLVAQTLGRDLPTWRILHTCPCCQNELQEDNPLEIRIMVAMDGNDSLKRVERRKDAADDSLAEISDSGAGGDYFLSRTSLSRVEKWHNASDKNTGKSWAKFDENGIFLLICEKAKYSLASMHHFLEAERQYCISNGENAPPKGKLCFAYDIGCTNSKTVPAVGTMHGYAHERACQLNFLLLYQTGTGLEDGETSEQYFSKSNSLASATRHASIFHRRQMITEYAYHTDNFETYGNLSKFLRNHYSQALEILGTAPSLRIRMREAGIKDARVIFQWMEEEAVYLQNLSREPPTSALERAQHHAQENERKILADVHALESKLNVHVRWTEGSVQWEEAGALVTGAKYRRALDKLEGLLVSRIFEPSQLNISGTGYKMRKHLASALKKRSKSIQSAITEYNTVAAKMKPKRQPVDWEEVVEYAFLSEFDILRDTREDIRERPWAVPANRVIGAEDELSRVHQEIRRLITYMQQEKNELITRERELMPTNPTLALQVRNFRRERGRFHEVHKKRLLSITKLPGFDWSTNSKYFFPGTPVERRINRTSYAAEDLTTEKRVDEDNTDDDDDDEEDEEDEDEELVHRIDTFLSVATDVLEE
ncbi:hypothetical protein F5877DRAFT_93080 [Lentinula edodes]|nr:hypothetical protein F5877DRAFT_93080 [Lentinula edodes]